jgi:hypothetical protein
VDGGVTCENPCLALPEAPADTTLLLLLCSPPAPAPAPLASLTSLVHAVLSANAFGRTLPRYDLHCEQHIVVQRPVVGFLPVRWTKRGARLDVRPVQVWEAYHQGIALFLEWREKTSLRNTLPPSYNDAEPSGAPAGNGEP